MPTKIKFVLSVSEVRKAQQQIREYQNQLNYKIRVFAERLAEEGVYIERMQIAEYNAIYSSELISSIQSEYKTSAKDSATWVVKTDCPYAKYVEFGFGIVGSENPHPDTSIVGWKYDINDNGEKGWFYQKDGEWHWSNGQPSKPFMYMTAQQLRLRVQSIAKEVFG